MSDDDLKILNQNNNSGIEYFNQIDNTSNSGSWQHGNLNLNNIQNVFYFTLYFFGSTCMYLFADFSNPLGR